MCEPEIGVILCEFHASSRERGCRGSIRPGSLHRVDKSLGAGREEMQVRMLSRMLHREGDSSVLSRLSGAGPQNQPWTPRPRRQLFLQLKREESKALWFLKQTVMVFKSPQVHIRQAAVRFAGMVGLPSSWSHRVPVLGSFKQPEELGQRADRAWGRDLGGRRTVCP